ncbi:ferrochelatase [Actinomyces urogenitalis DSM 15434]|uniref:Ferrochelatase n=1 Tax=Actinomyces urogenitalis DSM 15434 TaxID=525246 RepID=C0W557_9ACTO|nr:ferrochelatase [Actinomyces urogenitalis]EEH66133.1 ferrochelatase [Actinomyces urogenitalis DSM 15434]KGF02971.1 ferrochelatase [Actinomyces urogenitalis S6-C4]MBS6071794.1 ferrochelatase [Actinomyces urogenitalis]MDK8237705.1 ferrochelatase [Actinomyces urogenitalis]MDK8835585.1 ferrochelatase [Actinomyces urogenitalis]
MPESTAPTHTAASAGRQASAPASPDPLAPYDAVLILSYGGPMGPDDVLPFMRNATAGRGVPDSRLLEVSGHYGRFEGVSPINARNAEMLEALRAELARRGSRVPVAIGNRNWHPFVSEAMRSLADAGARHVLTMTTSAYGSYSGCRQYREDTAAALALLAAGADGETGQGWEVDAAARVGGAGGAPVELAVDKTRPFYNTPGMLEANVDAIVDAYRQLEDRGVDAAGVRLVLVTHSVPLGMEEDSSPHAAERAAGVSPAVAEPGVAPDLSTEISYVEQHRRLAEVLLPQVRERLGMAEDPQTDLVYCSRSGPPQARWLEPDVNDHLEALAAGRLTDGTAVAVPAGVVVAPIGFVADHMEVVFDLDTEARETAERLHLPYVRAATAGTHPAFISSLADILVERAAVARGEEVEPDSTTGTGPFHTVCPDVCCRPGVRRRPHARPGGPHGQD